MDVAAKKMLFFFLNPLALLAQFGSRLSDANHSFSILYIGGKS